VCQDDRPLAQAGEKVKGVLGMAFMQRSMHKQREEASKLLDDLKAMERGEGLSDESDYGEDYGAVGKVSRTKRPRGGGQGGEGFESSEEDEEGAGHGAVASGGGAAAKRRAAAAERSAKKSKKGPKPLAEGASLLEQVPKP
jgi:U3 small nucleolar RNA-associated protein 14